MQYQGSQSTTVDKKRHQLPCKYEDGTTASFKTKNSIFIGTKKTVQKQIAHTSTRAPEGEGSPCGCPTDRNSCTNATFKNGTYKPGDYSCSATWHTRESEEFYVADAENFIIYVSDGHCA
jgi:hypothetical protein